MGLSNEAWGTRNGERALPDAWRQGPGAAKGNSHALKHGRYSAVANAERRHLAGLFRNMKGFIDEIDGAD